MSISFAPLNPVCVMDPIMILNNERDFAVLKCGSQTSWKQWTSTSVSNSSINFSMPPPSGSVVVDRKMYLYLTQRLTFTGTPPVGQKLLNPNLDAPRAYPIASSLETIQLSVNNQSMSFNCADVIQALMHFNTNESLKNGDYSMTPNCQDQSQQYADLIGSIRSPLQGYGDSNDENVLPRGGFPFTIVSNPVSAGAAVTAVVDVAFCEPLFLSPLYFGEKNGSGFYNVNSMDLTLNFVQNIANRMWSHCPDLLGVNDNIVVSTTSTFGGLTNGPTTIFKGGQQCAMFIKYITPQETQVLSPQKAITYPYFDVQRFTTDNSPVNAGVTQIFTSNNVQLSSIPRRLYIYIREKNQDLYSNCSNTDTYFSIQNVNIQFMNKNGLLSSCNQNQLYQMAKKNHCNMSYTQWSGGPVYKAGSFTQTMGTIGSILSVEFASDIGLDSIDAPGKLQQCTLQVQVTATNISGRTISPSLMVVPVLEGSFTIQGLGSASVNIGVITSKDIYECQGSPFVNYSDLEQVNGGNFFSGLYDFGKKVHDFVKNHKLVSKGLLSPLGTVLDVVTGLPISKPLGYVSKHFGYGEGGASAGIVIGGQNLPRAQLRRRLH